MPRVDALKTMWSSFLPAARSPPRTACRSTLPAPQPQVEAPFRQFRLVIFSFFAVSAGAATLFGVPQIIATVVGAANAKSVEEVGMDAVINVGALLLCGFLAKRELDSRDKSIARIRREETLGQCKVELSTGRVTQLGSLRSFSRCIVFAGTPEHVQRCIDAAEPFKDRLLDAGVTLVPLPIFGEPVDGVPTPPAEDEDKRWRVRAVRTDEWKAWLLDQMATAGKTEKEARERGLFIGLRLDGRVRSSGLGVPPFERFSLELAPLEGENAWGGLLDGFDGRVSMFQ